MAPSTTPNITQLLVAWNQGDQDALAQLTPLVYRELHRLAHGAGLVTPAIERERMTPERYQRIGRLFDEALERAFEARAAFLEQTSGADAGLHAEVEKLLTHHSDSEDFFFLLSDTKR